jgi:hypothetical protein
VDQVDDDAGVIGGSGRVGPLDLADPLDERRPVETLSVFVDGSGQVPADLHGKRRGEILGVALGKPLAQRRQRCPDRSDCLAGGGQFKPVLNLAGELVEVHTVGSSSDGRHQPTRPFLSGENGTGRRGCHPVTRGHAFRVEPEPSDCDHRSRRTVETPSESGVRSRSREPNWSPRSARTFRVGERSTDRLRGRVGDVVATDSTVSACLQTPKTDAERAVWRIRRVARRRSRRTGAGGRGGRGRSRSVRLGVPGRSDYRALTDSRSSGDRSRRTSRKRRKLRQPARR